MLELLDSNGDIRMVVGLVKIVVQVTALLKIGRVQVNKGPRFPGWCVQFQKLDSIEIGERYSATCGCDTSYSIDKLRLVVPSIDLPCADLVPPPITPPLGFPTGWFYKEEHGKPEF